MGINTTVIPLNASAVKADILATVGSDINLLGEIRTFTLSIAGSLTKAQLQAKGWAICDGTTPSAQGITDAIITTTPDLREKFLRHSADETTGGTGGSETSSHNHLWLDGRQSGSNYDNIAMSDNVNYRSKSGDGSFLSGDSSGLNDTAYTSTDNVDIIPPYYDICYFIKVKV